MRRSWAKTRSRGRSRLRRKRSTCARRLATTDRPTERMDGRDQCNAIRRYLAESGFFVDADTKEAADGGLILVQAIGGIGSRVEAAMESIAVTFGPTPRARSSRCDHGH